MNIKVASTLIFLFALLGANAIEAHEKYKPQPESIVTCVRGDDYVVLSRSVPVSINLEQCLTRGSPPDEDYSSCAPCIRSLERQGCKSIDVTVFPTQLNNWDHLITYLLSCEKP